MERPTLAHRVVAAFGGARELWRALLPYHPDLDPMTVYRWTYPAGPRHGTGGRIPPERLRSVLEAARRQGIILELTVEDLL